MGLFKKYFKEISVRTTRLYSSCSTHSDAKLKIRPFSEIPGLPMLPLIGTAWHYMPIIGRYRLDRQNESNRDKRNRFGDIVRERIGSFYIVQCFRAEDLHEMVNNEGSYPYRVEFTSIKTYRESRKQWFSTSGLLAVQGEEWYNLRSKSQGHLLKPSSIQQYLIPLHDVSAEFVKKILENRDSNNEVHDFVRELYKWTLESVCLIGLDTRLGCLESNLSEESDGMKIINSVLEQFQCMIKLESFSGHLQFWKLFPTPLWRKYIKCSDIYSEIAFKYINKALSNLESKKGHTYEQLTLIQAMMAEEKLDVKDIMVFVADLLMAGIETTAYCAGFLLYNLARNPDKQDQLYKEITEFLPTKDLKITSDVYNNMKYLKACFKETLRLYPVVGGTARCFKNDIVLSGYQIPAGTLVTAPYHEIFTSEKYFPKANQFIPERWLKKEKTVPFAYAPFGFGARSCIGRRLAELEILLLTAEIMRHFKVEYHLDDIGVKTLMANAPDKPLRFNFIER